MGGETADKTDEHELEEGAEGQQEQSGKATAQNDAQNASGEAEGGQGGGAEGADEGEGFEVIEEGGANAGAGRAVPISTHIKLKQKLKGKVKEAQGDAAAARTEAELLRLQLKQKDEELARLKVKPMPKESDFPGQPEKYDEAMRQYIAEQSSVAAVEAVRKAAPQQQAQDDDDADDEVLQAYAERRERLRAPDFDEAEDAVIEALGQKTVRRIIGEYDNSEAVVYALGKNPAKLAEIAKLVKTNPIRAVRDLTLYASKLQLKPRGKAPEPNSADDLKGSAGSTTDPQKLIDNKMADVQAGKCTFDDYLKFKKALREKGGK